MGVYGTVILCLSHHYILALWWKDNQSLQFTTFRLREKILTELHWNNYKTQVASCGHEPDLDNKIPKLGPESDTATYDTFWGLRS